MAATKQTSSKGGWSGMGMQEKLMVFMTLGIIVMSFFLGYFYGQVTALRGGGVLGAAGGAALAGAGAGADNYGAGEAPPPPEPITEELLAEVLDNAVASKGDDNAPVTLVEFTDYQCPFCKRHFEETASQIEENYVDTGQVRYIALDLPLAFHGNASAAAQAARCAGDQGDYWGMHDRLFEGQEEWSVGDPTETFSGYATELGLNAATFDACLADETYADAVDENAALASRVGATGTPTFLINGELLVGAQPYSAFEQVIEAAL